MHLGWDGYWQSSCTGMHLDNCGYDPFAQSFPTNGVCRFSFCKRQASIPTDILHFILGISHSRNIGTQGAQSLAIEAQVRYVCPRRKRTMARVQPKATPNWCSQVKPDEPWTGRCVKEKIADDGKRHRCDKKENHDDNVHACKCGLGWKQF